MAGHSKWATTKRHKAAQDAKRGKIFSVLSKEISISARAGGGDPEFNVRLRTLINTAKGANMPAENIDRAIKKGTGELPGMIIEELTYEGYAPGGVGIIVEVTTDNKNRSASEVRSIFTKNGGNLAGAGALAYNFHRKGQFLIDAKKIPQEDILLEIALEAGAEDVLNHKDFFEILCPINEYDKIAHVLEEKSIKPDTSEIAYIPNTLVPISDLDIASKILKLIDKLENQEDVKSVYANYDIDDKIMESLSSNT